MNTLNQERLVMKNISKSFPGVKALDNVSFDINNEKQFDLLIKTKKRKLVPRSLNQKKYFELLNNKNIVFAIGPAGTGKTFLAVAKAVSYLQQGLVKKIILYPLDKFIM